MRDAKTKSTLRNALKVEVLRRLVEQDVQATFLDRCAVLWVVPWPTSGTVHGYLVRSYLHGHLAESDIEGVLRRQPDAAGTKGRAGSTHYVAQLACHHKESS